LTIVKKESVGPTLEMAESRGGQERLLKQLVSTFRCPVCRRGFEGDHVRVAARHQHLWVVSVRCGRCRNQQVFWIALKDAQEQSILRDLTREEEEQFASLPPVTGDDVLDMHEFLRGFNGNFRGLFVGRET
jgi:hypothetical protein